MKNYPLAFQIWVVISIITLLISGLLVVILPHTLRDFFTDEMYSTIQMAQETYTEPNPYYIPNIDEEDSKIQRYFIEGNIGDNPDHDTRKVQHFLIHSNGNLETNNSIPVKLLKKATNEALNQKKSSQKYVIEFNNEKIFYIITEAVLETKFANFKTSEDIYLVSFINDSYREDLVQTLFKKLTSITFIILISSWIPSLLLSRHLSQPLVNLEKKVEGLTNRNWNQVIELDRKDEIGKLGHSIDKLRQELIRQDQVEQSFLQNISHELKTPTMVIRSYIEAISDGIYPGGTLESSLDVINEETLRLEEKIQSLLYLTKLDFLSSEKLILEKFYLDELIEDTINRIMVVKSNIYLDVNLDQCLVEADPEQMNIIIENILDNALRYAKSTIKISLTDESNFFKLQIWNDGSSIKDEDMDTIFEKFHKGKDGVIGLGLSIVKRIIDIHNFKISAKNENNGVSFYIIINK